jgi:hypothetical protein
LVRAARLEFCLPKKGEVEATLADWLNEVERVQLMLRLTPRLREKYQD